MLDREIVTNMGKFKDSYKVGSYHQVLDQMEKQESYLIPLTKYACLC